ncbi:hypothetical protein KY284_010846 [Solanum tuberosum]|nr:hypothetical protein KY284_010846 [Solanum tuberosum]
MLMREREENTSFPFPLLITQSYERTGVPFRASIDVKVTTSSSTDIRRLRHSVCKMIRLEGRHYNQILCPLLIPLILQLMLAHLFLLWSRQAFPLSYCPSPLTQTMIYKMGSLSQSTLVRAIGVEMDMPRLIDHAIKKALPHFIEYMVKCDGTIESHIVRLDDLTTRLEAREKGQGSSGALDSMRDKIATLRAEVVQLPSMNISMIWVDGPLQDAPAPMPKMPSVVPPSSDQPDIAMHVWSVDADKNERADDDLAEGTDEKELQAEENGLAETLTKLQEINTVILHVALERSLRESSKVGSSGVTPDPTF